jgi:hypothetical protein
VLLLDKELLTSKKVHLFHFRQKIPQKAIRFVLEKFNLFDDLLKSLSSDLALQGERQLFQESDHGRTDNVIIDGIVVNVASNILLKLIRQPGSFAKLQHGI